MSPPGLLNGLLRLGVIALWSVAIPALATDEPVDELKTIVQKVKQIERDLLWERFGVKDLADANKQLSDFKLKATACISSNEAELAKVEAAIEQLGEKKPREPTEVAKQRRQQETDRKAVESKLAECNALALHVAKLYDSVELARKQLLEERMLVKGPDIFTVIGRLLGEPGKWLVASGQYIEAHSWLMNKATTSDIVWSLASLIAGLVLGLLLRQQGLPVVAQRRWSGSSGGRFAASMLASCCHDSPYVLASLSTAICLAILTHGITPLPFFTVLAYGLSLYFIANLLIRISLDPTPPGKLFIKVPLPVAQPMARRIRVLMIILLVVSPLVNTVLVQSLPDFAQSLAHTIVRILIAINIVWVLWLFRHLTGVKRTSWFRNLLSLVLVVAVIADLSGYSNLSGWLFRSVFGSLAAFTIVMTIARLVRDFLMGLEYGATSLGRKTRRFFGLPATEEHISGFFWVRMLVSLGLWGLLAWLFVLIWDLSASAVHDINLIVTEGFQVGSLRIIPARVLLAVVTLAGLIALASWLKGRIKNQLEKSPMERGSREAVVTVSGYGGVLIAVLVALGVAGIDFANLAIIAGALSVGIGFGLQNIVNNFVSGLILLIERPIKTGDWIAVGTTEGYVKRIRIRSTQVQTFDRADVIVPNSELISSQVTNWMLHDITGRARIPVGVAYGSDTQKVKDILLEVAKAHPEVITNKASMAPFVLFLGFGDSALNFELRVYVNNVDHRLKVTSDINFAIDAAFREAGISIPFPQRDVHISYPKDERDSNNK